MSERGFHLFLRDVCAMANYPVTSEIEYLLREYIKIIEFTYNEDVDEDTAYFEQAQLLSFSASRIFTTDRKHWHSDLLVMKRRVGYPLEEEQSSEEICKDVPEPAEASAPTLEVSVEQHLSKPAEEFAPTPEVLPPQDLWMVEQHTLPECDTDKFNEGTAIHEDLMVADLVTPIAGSNDDFTATVTSVKRRGRKRKIKKFVRTVQTNEFLERIDSIDRPPAARVLANCDHPYYLSDHHRRSLPRRAPESRCRDVIIDNARILEDQFVQAQARRLIDYCLYDKPPDIGLNLAVLRLHVRRIAQLGSRWKPSAKFKTISTLLLN